MGRRKIRRVHLGGKCGGLRCAQPALNHMGLSNVSVFPLVSEIPNYKKLVKIKKMENDGQEGAPELQLWRPEAHLGPPLRAAPCPSAALPPPAHAPPGRGTPTPAPSAVTCQHVRYLVGGVAHTVRHLVRGRPYLCHSIV